MKFSSLIIVLLAFCITACGSYDSQTESMATDLLNPVEFGQGDLIHQKVDQLPEPVGGFQNYFQTLANNLKYPEDAKKKGLEGKVLVQFIISKQGEVTNVEVLEGFHPECNLAAAQIVAKSDKWNPGIKDGKTVNTQLVLPITFKLKG